MLHDDDIVELYRANAVALGRAPEPVDNVITFSTDMGNISRAMPSIHPCIAIESGGAMNHQPEFAAFCATPTADKAMRDGAVAMAWTAIDVATGPLRDRLITR